EFALIAMGGAAALHAVDLARELNMARVIIPPMSGNFSAIGLAVANIQRDYVRTFGKKAGKFNPSELESIFHALEAEGVETLLNERVSRENMVISWSADMRYEGQSWELNIPVEPVKEMSETEIQKITHRFHQIHYQVYSYSEPRESVEFVNLRARVVGKNPTLSLPRKPFSGSAGCAVEKAIRNIWFEPYGWNPVPVFERASLKTGSAIPGPCIIEEPICTILIPHGFSGEVDGYSNILIPISSEKNLPDQKILPDQNSGKGFETR
ncbi:MAG: hydantoinase/oxoprolinase family protein, partial [Thermodesulfobacteriota bacterium]